MRKFQLLFFLFIMFSGLSLCASFSEEQLINLSEDDEWLALLHINEDGESHIVDNNFFATSVPIDPYKELKFLINNKTHILIEKFPARYAFIFKHAGEPFEYGSIPDISQFLENINASTISLFCASPYMGSSMSYFGHTFLRLNKINNPLLSSSISFSGEIPEDISFVKLAMKGIGGNLSGKYVIYPFYEFLEKYSKIEQRTLIEYKLNFSREEIQRLVLHLYELKNLTNINYSFIFDNCSTGLIPLFDVLRPSLHLSQDFGSIVFPYDLPDKLYELGLITEINLIKPILEKSNDMYESLSLRDKLSFKKIMNSENKFDLYKQLDGQDSIKIAHLVSNSYDIKFKMNHEAPTDYITVKKEFAPYKNRLSQEYFNLPNSNNTSLAYEFSNKRKSQKHTLIYTPLSTRGYSTSFSNMQVGFVELGTTKISIENGKLYLDEFNLITMESLTDINQFKFIPSKTIDLGFTRRRNQTLSYRFNFDLGIGVTMDVFGAKIIVIPTMSLLTAPFDFILSLNIGGCLNLDLISFGINSKIHIGSFQNNFGNTLVLFSEMNFIKNFRAKFEYDFINTTIVTSLTYMFN